MPEASYCQRCANPIVGRLPTAKFCSKQCQQRWHWEGRMKRRQETRDRLVCRECGRTYSAPTTNTKFCSPQCRRRASRNRRPTAHWLYHVKHTYGLAPEEALAMLERQGNRCAICGGECRSGKRLAVDHDHETGAVRGFLCEQCNHGIGNFRDDVDLLASALSYLINHQAEHARPR